MKHTSYELRLSSLIRYLDTGIIAT